MANEQREALAAYVLDGGVDQVFGWLSPAAMTVTMLADAFQRDAGIAGEVAEIGVHHGKLFLLLALLRRPGETAFAADIFEDQSRNVDGSGLGDREILLGNIARFGAAEPITLVAKDSLELRPGDMPSPSGIRIFSVDGSHTAQHTLSDLAFAASVLADGGIVLLDDFYNPRWPGVQEGYHRFAATLGDRLVPVLYGANKLWLAQAHWAPRYLAWFRRQALFSACQELTLHGHAVLYAEALSPAVAFHRSGLRPRQCAFVLGDAVANRLVLGPGWGGFEGSGAWTVSGSASFTFESDLPEGVPATLSLELSPLLHAARASRALELTMNGVPLAPARLHVAGFTTLEREVPSGVVRARNTVDMVIEGPEVPAAVLPGHTDRRTLGFLLRAVSLEGRAS